MTRRKKTARALRLRKCVYCGVPATTRDHPVPKCLFVEPLPSNVQTVPACAPCNAAKAIDDQFIRDLLATDLAASSNATVKQLFEGPVTRALSRNRSEVGRVVAGSDTRRVDLRTPAGLYIGEAYQATLPDGRVSRILTQMIRGLYWSSVKRTLPQDIVSVVYRRSPSDLPMFLENLGTAPELLYPGVFGCRFRYATEKPALTLWLCWFFDTVVYSIETYPSEADRLDFEARFGPRGATVDPSVIEISE